MGRPTSSWWHSTSGKLGWRPLTCPIPIDLSRARPSTRGRAARLALTANLQGDSAVLLATNEVLTAPLSAATAWSSCPYEMRTRSRQQG